MRIAYVRVSTEEPVGSNAGICQKRRYRLYSWIVIVNILDISMEIRKNFRMYKLVKILKK